MAHASEERLDDRSDYGSLRPGARLGRYQLLLAVARGGMARVWAARVHGEAGPDASLVAIKTILPDLASEADFERMFLDEARIASNVDHDNVCRIHELGEQDRTLYLAMEWVEGESFARVLRPAGKTLAVDPRIAARVVADACRGAHAAHELTDDDGQVLSVVHRDLSPHNILVDVDGHAKVADFGVAKALNQLHDATTAGQLKGKLPYMAPEQVTGEGLDRRSDVFSLGCVLYEATTGTKPFRGDSDHQIMHAILQCEPTPPSQIVPGFPPALERIILRALSRRPVMRFGTAEKLGSALEEFLAACPAVSRADVGALVKERLGEVLAARHAKIQTAIALGDRIAWSDIPSAPDDEVTAHRSGVKSAQDKGRADPPASPTGEVASLTTVPDARPAPEPTSADRTTVPVPAPSSIPPRVAPPPSVAPRAAPPASVAPITSPPTSVAPVAPPAAAANASGRYAVVASGPYAVMTTGPFLPVGAVGPPLATGGHRAHTESAPVEDDGEGTSLLGYILAACLGVVLAALIGAGACVVYRARHPGEGPFIGAPRPVSSPGELLPASTSVDVAPSASVLPPASAATADSVRSDH